MNKTEFIQAIREMADVLEKGHFKFINLETGYIFGNRNYGAVEIEITPGVRISVNLYNATEEEKLTASDTID